nr:MAG TPA: hypothetical protein [Caudoviricetes sp.]
MWVTEKNTLFVFDSTYTFIAMISFVILHFTCK